MYKLIWKNEIIDETDSKEDADYLAREYTLAYGGFVKVVKNG